MGCRRPVDRLWTVFITRGSYQFGAIWTISWSLTDRPQTSDCDVRDRASKRIYAACEVPEPGCSACYFGPRRQYESPETGTPRFRYRGLIHGRFESGSPEAVDLPGDSRGSSESPSGAAMASGSCWAGRHPIGGTGAGPARPLREPQEKTPSSGGDKNALLSYVRGIGTSKLRQVTISQCSPHRR